MNTSPTLLVLAAGMASRYGSLKQLDHFGPNGETIIDYSIYDAIKAGFGKVVFVIRESIEDTFKQEMIDKFSDKIEVDYVLQELDMLPQGFSVPVGRTKPWGTGHAVWRASAAINEPFAVINADDFYGYQSFKIAADYLRENAEGEHYALVGYRLNNTLSPHGAVSRGVCEVDSEGFLESITEQTHIERIVDGIFFKDQHDKHFRLQGDEIVSMNLMAFTPSIFNYFESHFINFLNTTKSLTAEFYLPELVNELVTSGKAHVKVLPTPARWFGVTFPEDKPLAVIKIKELVRAGQYPEDLWATPLQH